MFTFSFGKSALVATFILAAAVGTARAQVCVQVDEAHDTLSPQDRAAAILLLDKQFELAGKRIVPNCAAPYSVGHIRLGNTITVTLSGQEGYREGVAHGLEELPALYSQLVRSLVNGRGVIDRTNVTTAQASALRVHSDLFGYFRLGYGTAFGERTYGMPNLGFGYRRELDSFALDASILNLQIGTSRSGSNTTTVHAGSMLKLEGLRYVDSKANATPYLGGGLSWGSFDSDTRTIASKSTYSLYSSGTSGMGLQGELSAGYESGRATTLRWFVQTDATLPFYRVRPVNYTVATPVTTTWRYVPSFVVSVGVGWQKNRR